MTQEDIIFRFKQNNGWIHSADFDYQTVVYELLHKMIQNGLVKKVKNGLYRLIKTEYNEWNFVSKHYPKGVFCLFSAWQQYQLTTTVSYQYHIAFMNNANPPKIDYPPVQFYYWSKSQFELGIVEKDEFLIYDIEKSVCDAVKFRNKVGEEIMYEVIKNYMKRQDRNLNKIMEYAEKMRVLNIIEPIIKSLL